MPPVNLVEVTTLEQRRVFVQFPTKMYKDVPQYIPNTYDDDLHDWDPKSNPAFEYCEARCWLAYREGEAQPVGRIGAILSHRANEKWGTHRMRFSQVDFVDDPEVSAALFAAVEGWAREKGCDEVQGPLGFSDLDREGMLVEGFDRRSCFFTYYNYPYYPEHLERLGYVKDADWIENLIDVPTDDASVAKWDRLSGYVKSHYPVHEHTATNRLSYIPLLPAFFRLVNLCYSPLYGTVELSDKQISKYATKFAPLINPKLTAFVMDDSGEMIAMGVGAPSIAEALKKHDGRLLPFGWVDLLRAFRKNDTIDLLLVAIHPDWQKKGVGAILIDKLLHGCLDIGITKAETGPTLETNEAILSLWKRFTAVQHKRRRCFVKKLG
ncbi:MAG: GNAT family N-acetyltransferase [Eggerthellaceae bacterium]|nr:GNAT family N-acetyltransferase [Eggerthellaceae bacterium]